MVYYVCFGGTILDITTLAFLSFVAISLLIYYLLPQKTKWCFLVFVSLFFVAIKDYRAIVFIFASSVSVFYSAKCFQNSQYDFVNKKRKTILVLTLVFNIGILFCVKYLEPIINIFYRSFSSTKGVFLFDNLIVPLGISYYTLQIVSYLLDVYWGRIEAETNYGKILLFTCYFPQMIQGPISRYGELSGEFFKEHKFNIDNLKFGLQLMLWGFFKKLVIADKIAGIVDRTFDLNTENGSTIVVGLVCYGIQLYCDFGGGIDVVRGVSECFDIRIAENFCQPYFSKSLGEFWRRWHITLGSWMKDYVFYPLSLSKPMTSFKRSLKKKISRTTVNRIQIAICDIVVFLLVGYWHGSGSIFWGWGLYNGIILAISALLVDFYANCRKKLNITSESKIWSLVFIARTLVIVTLGWAFDCANSAWEALGYIKNIFTVTPTYFSSSFDAVNANEIMAILPFCLVVLAVSIIKENGINVREKINKLPYFVKVIIWVALIEVIACFGRPLGEVGFMYANF